MAKRTAAPRLWIRIDLGSDDKIGPGKIELLRAVAAQESIAGAARKMHMSYRRAWLLIDSLNGAFGAPVVETHVGGRRQGGARLTELGQTIVAQYDEIDRLANEAAVPAVQRLASLRRRRR